MGSRNKELFNNTALYTISNIITRLLSFFMVPLYTYVLTTQEFGTIDLIFTTLNLSLPIFTLCINQATLRFTLEAKEDKKLVFSYSLMVVFSGIVLLLLAMVGFFYANGMGKYLFTTTMLLSSNFLYVIISEFVRGLEEIRVFIIGNIISAFISVSLNIVTIVFLNWGVNGYIISFTVAYCVATAYYIIKMRLLKYLTAKIFERKNTLVLKKMIKYSAYLIPNTFFWWITNASDRYMILYYLGTHDNGIYAVSNKVPIIITSVCGVFIQAWTLTAVKENWTRDNNDYNERVYQNVFSFTFIISSITLLFVKIFIRLYVPDNYFVSWKSSSFLIVAAALNVMASFIGTRYIVVMKNFGNMISTMLGAITNIIFNIILIPHFGITGAALATYISYFVVVIYRIFDTKAFKYKKEITELSKNNIVTWIVINLQIVFLFIDENLLSIYSLATCIVIIFLNRRIVKQTLQLAINYTSGRK